jgi:hypothetical protein
MAITGECFCGSVTYRINAPLGDGRSCHCSRCRKAFSSQASAYAEVEPGSLEWLSGVDLLTTYESGAGFGHQFCRRCGSTLCGIYHGQVHGVTLGCVNDDPGVNIEMHIYVGSKAPWEVIPEGVAQYDEIPSE